MRSFERIEICVGAGELRLCVLSLHHGMTRSVSCGTTSCIPVDVFARDPDSRLFPIKGMQIAQMGAHDITYFRE